MNPLLFKYFSCSRSLYNFKAFFTFSVRDKVQRKDRCLVSSKADSAHTTSKISFIMSVNSLLHIGFDLTLIAMILAAIRQNTGYVLAYEQYGISSYLFKYLGWGEWCYSYLVRFVKFSGKFRRQLPQDKFSQDLSGQIEELDRTEHKSSSRRRYSRH